MNYNCIVGLFIYRIQTNINQFFRIIFLNIVKYINYEYYINLIRTFNLSMKL